MDFLPLRPKVVLGVGAHPDDLDFMAGGTMAQFASQGAKIHYLIVTDGSKGSEKSSDTKEQIASTRQSEQKNALKALGGGKVIFLQYPDGELEVTMKLKKDIVRAIREIKPDVVITFDPSELYSATSGVINHPDHRAVGQATLDAVYPLARDHLAFPEQIEQGFEPHKTPTVLLLTYGEGNYFFDISKNFDQKITALTSHASQIKDRDKTIATLRKIATKNGQKAGYVMAECFVRIDINSQL